MSYFGCAAFENDDALDWLAGVTRANAERKIRKGIADYLAYVNKGAVPEPLTAEQIEGIVEDVRDSHRRFPPKSWIGSGRPIDKLLDEEETEIRDRYKSGRYLDEQYGPVEIAVAASELVSILAGSGPRNLPENVAEFAITLRDLKLPLDILDKAISAIRLVLSNDRYRRMRAFHLAAFPDVSGGDDDMASICELLDRLLAAASSRPIETRGKA
jgi:hypothetical protein